MFKKIMSLLLIGLIINLVGVNFAYADSKSEKEARFIEKVKAGIQSLGTGEAARVEVKLRDKTKLKGYISQTDTDGFSVVDDKTGIATRVVYPQVKQAKGNNLTNGEKIAIGVAIGLGITLLLLITTSDAF